VHAGEDGGGRAGFVGRGAEDPVQRGVGEGFGECAGLEVALVGQREGVDDLETVSVRQIVELGLYVDRGRSGTLSVPSKVAFCSTPAALAATFAAVDAVDAAGAVGQDFCHLDVEDAV
jgi:hypothetical protein